VDDYPTKARSDLEIRRHAEALLKYWEVSNTDRLDVLACLNNTRVLTVKGERRLEYFVCDDAEMAGDDARTEYSDDVVRIRVKRSVHRDAWLGDGRSRNTLAHELGHAVLHEGAPKMRRTGATGRIASRWLKPYESAEHQAKVFAAAILINEQVADTLPDAEEISVRFGVSLQSAQICFDTLAKRRDRAASADRVARKAAEFCAQPTPDPIPIQPRFLKEPCTACGRLTLSPVGMKYRCATCGTVGDRFQDGDSWGA
jgi:hypothetical protein